MGYSFETESANPLWYDFNEVERLAGSVLKVAHFKRGKCFIGKPAHEVGLPAFITGWPPRRDSGLGNRFTRSVVIFKREPFGIRNQNHNSISLRALFERLLTYKTTTCSQ